MDDSEQQALQLWRTLLTDRLNRAELKTLCFELKVDYEELGGDHTPFSNQLEGLLSELGRKRKVSEFTKHITTQTEWRHLAKAYYEAIYQRKADELADLDAAESPYRGMLAYEEEHAPLFFGRNSLSDEVVLRLRASVKDEEQKNFLAVIGASGSGKSSLVRAGMLPKLRALGWPITIATPTADPLEALALELTRESESVIAAKTLKDDMGQTEEALHLWLKKHHTGQHPFLLLLDQFEEAFTLCQNDDLRESYVNNLLFALAPERDNRLAVVLTLRADFYAQVAWSDGLRTLLEKQQKYIGPMVRGDLKRSIEGPAKLSGLFDFEDGLVEQILDDVADEKGGLPLLSHALLETWKLREKSNTDGEWLTFGGYRKAGGVSGAIAQTADQQYQALKPQEKEIAKNIFTRLTKLGEGKEDTRQRASLTELIPSDSNADEVMNVLAQLATARLITTDKDQVDVTHEALIREWDRLKGG